MAGEERVDKEAAQAAYMIWKNASDTEASGRGGKARRPKIAIFGGPPSQRTHDNLLSCSQFLMELLPGSHHDVAELDTREKGGHDLQDAQWELDRFTQDRTAQKICPVCHSPNEPTALRCKHTLLEVFGAQFGR